MSLNSSIGLHQETSTPDEIIDCLDETDLREIVESIKEAQYFDANSMAPLTPAALVSTFVHCIQGTLAD